MPCRPEDAPRQNHKANTDALRRMWSEGANKVLEATGDEGRAVRSPNGVVARNGKNSLAERFSGLIWPR
ncbi:hypothetical protein [uncultured Rhodoblastus sp.]|uniref:hypothetical protein n=1 Tax=uncultured Rhodoblastus sp. TaxID=543037 RepID=UPI0025CDB01A|nr:hypothetical protein [uncultured Rhodoblastus sp.]